MDDMSKAEKNEIGSSCSVAPIIWTDKYEVAFTLR